tara:strand:- start:328 stop:744 length:417 start_codon:yes stop_codon:yes gene_type:complete
MGGRSRPPAPPKIEPTPPPVEDISAAYQSPTMRQEIARRQRRGAFVTRGQTLGKSGEVLGASPVELANVRQATGTDQPEKELTLEEFTKQNPVTVKTGMPSGRKAKQKQLEKKQYEDYLKKLKKEQESFKPATKGQTI